MDRTILAVEYAKGVDYSNVRHDDRSEVENIVAGLVSFERNMPKLQVDIHDAKDHYLISVKGYNHGIDFDKFYKQFRGDNSPYDFIQSVVFTPSSGIFVIDVKKRDFSESQNAVPTSVTVFAEPSPPAAPRRSRSKSKRRSRSKSRRR